MRVVFAFGTNDDGQCGKAIRSEQAALNYPVVVKFPDPRISIVAISAGSRHTLALSSEGQVFSWGWGRSGQLGLGDTHSSSHPMLIPTLRNVMMVSAGGMHSGCVDADNLCYTWGSNSYGQLGLGKLSTSESAGFVTAPTLLRLEQEKDSTATPPLLVQRISCGGMHSAAISTDGELYCWGKSDSGQTGFSTWYLDFAPSVYYPHKVPGLQGRAMDVSCGGFYTLVLTEKNRVFAMGKEDFGCLGTGSDMDTSMSIGVETPTLVCALREQRVVQLSAGGWHSLFVTASGCLYSCGKGEYGRLGQGSESAKQEPVRVMCTADGAEVTGVLQASAGGSHTIWRDSHNRIFTAGRLDGGRCGAGSLKGDRAQLGLEISQYLYPGPVDEASREIVEVVAGGAHTFIIANYSDVTEESSAAFLAAVKSFQASLYTSDSATPTTTCS